MSKTTSPQAKLVKENRSNREEAGPKRNGWSAEDLGEESSYEGTTEISRRLRRGNETVADPNDRDVAGAIPTEDTPHGRGVQRTPRESANDNLDEKPG